MPTLTRWYIKSALVYFVAALLNVGIWLVVAYSVFQADRVFLVVGRGVEIGAAVFFASHAWGRTLSREGA